MSGKVLVVYATRYGSTGEVAEAVADRLRDHGLDVDLTTVKKAGAVAGYDGVVIGAPFYVGSVHKEARVFMEQQRSSLERLPVAVFALGPTSADDDLAESRKQLDAMLEKLPWLRPVAAEMFVGRYDPSHLKLADKLLTALPASPLHGLEAHDDRDWHAITAWADEVGETLVQRLDRPT